VNQKNKIMKNLIFILILILIGCQQETKKESLYFLYYGDKDVSFPDLVIKNDKESFVDSIMPVGQPVEYLVNLTDFNSLESAIQKKAPFIENNEFSTGIMVIHYVNKQKKHNYLYKEGEVSEFLKMLNRTLTGAEKEKVLEWITGVCKLKNIPIK
jgi:hypothetical protein